MLQFKNTIGIFQKYCQAWKITFTWWPLFWTHSFSLREKVVITCSDIRRGMAHISLSIAFCNWGISRGLSMYTFPLRYPHKKKLQGDRSGELGGGHGISPLWEMNFPGNNFHNSAIASLEVWAVAPSCWNQIRNWFNRRLRNSGIKNFGSWQHNGRNSLSLNGHSLKKNMALSLRT